jgi:hypothetical protein
VKDRQRSLWKQTFELKSRQTCYAKLFGNKLEVEGERGCKS